MREIMEFNESFVKDFSALFDPGPDPKDTGNKYGCIDIVPYCKRIRDMYINPVFVNNRFAKTIYDGDASYD